MGKQFSLIRPLLLALCLGCLAATDVAPPVPLPPVNPPPKIQLSRGKAPADAGQVALEPGWTALSFPLGRLEGVAGLSFALYRQTPEGCVVVRPEQWSNLDTSVGYWVYAAQKETVRYWGESRPQEDTSELFAGWNLLGCPQSVPLALESLSFRSDDGQERTAAQATRSEGGQGVWLSATAYQPRSAFNLEPVPLERARLMPGRTLWLYAYRPLTLRRGVVTPSAVLSSDPGKVLRPGDTVTLRGAPAAEVQSVTLRGLPLPAGNIVSRGADQLTVRLPDWASSGELVPYRGTQPLAPVRLEVDAPDPFDQGLLMGQVEDADGEPLAGAQAQVGDRTASTGPDGRFYLAHLPAGPYSVTVKADGYRPGTGQIEIRPGKLSNLLTTLSPTEPDAGARRARMFITAYPFELEGRRFWVKSIRVWEVGHYSRRAYDSWWIDDSSRLLDFGNARLGSRVRIEITWVDDRGVQRFDAWDRRVWKDWQHEYFYSPWD